MPLAIKVESQVPQGNRDDKEKSEMFCTDLNKSAQPFLPQTYYTPPASHSAPLTEHLAQYLAQRDLVSSSLYQFDDKPENYRAWHSSYKNVTQGLGLTATEQLDLMTKWLGRESSNQCKHL